MNGKSIGLLRTVRLILMEKIIKNVAIIGERRIKMELNTAIRHALDGNAILFLGAGFSIGGTNKIGAKHYLLPQNFLFKCVMNLVSKEVTI